MGGRRGGIVTAVVGSCGGVGIILGLVITIGYVFGVMLITSICNQTTIGWDMGSVLIVLVWLGKACRNWWLILIILIILTINLIIFPIPFHHHPTPLLILPIQHSQKFQHVPVLMK